MANPAAEVRDADRDLLLVQRAAEARHRILEQIRRRIVGQHEVVEALLVTLLSRGHALFVGVPGLAKTLLISTLAQSLSLRSARIQFTPDLMPSDVVGTEVLEEDPASGRRRFRFVPGPIFTNVLLADEINRTPPKTQAALLQAMAEGHVTAGGHTHPLEPPFHVFATQNPIEQEGTYPLPEAQLDRFLLQILVDYPGEEDEVAIVQRTTAPEGPPPEPVLGREELLELQALVPRVPVAEHVVRYAVRLVRASRPDEASCPAPVREALRWGAGPRASQALVLTAKARALLAGRYAAEVEDVRAQVHAVLRHRLVLGYRALADGVRPDDVVDQLLDAVAP